MPDLVFEMLHFLLEYLSTGWTTTTRMLNLSAPLRPVLYRPLFSWPPEIGLAAVTSLSDSSWLPRLLLVSVWQLAVHSTRSASIRQGLQTHSVVPPPQPDLRGGPWKQSLAHK